MTPLVESGDEVVGAESTGIGEGQHELHLGFGEHVDAAHQIECGPKRGGDDHATAHLGVLAVEHDLAHADTRTPHTAVSRRGRYAELERKCERVESTVHPRGGATLGDQPCGKDGGQ